MKHFLAIVLIMLGGNMGIVPCLAQSQAGFDSLISLQQATQDNDPNTSIIYAKKALEWAEASMIAKQRIAAYEAMTNTHIDLGNYDLALSFTDMAKNLSLYVGDTSTLAGVYTDVSLIYDQLGDYPKALENSLMAVTLYKAMGDNSGLGYCYNDIGVIHYYRGDDALALNYFKRSFDALEMVGDSAGMSLFFNNTANIYSDNADYQRALDYYWKGYEYDIKLEDREGQAITLSNIGETYTAMEQYGKAEEYLAQALQLATEDHDPWAMSNPLRALGDLYRITGKYEKSLAVIGRGLAFADSIQAAAEMSAAYSSFSEVYEAMGDHETALGYLRKHKTLEDSLFNSNNTRSITEMETRFNTKEKETEIVLQKLEIDQRRNANFILGLGLALALVMAVFVFLAYRQKRRSNLQLEEKNVIIEEKNRDITDSIEFARTIQEAMLPSIDAITSNFTQSFVMFKPKDIVSGDFYWFKKDSKGDYVAAVDCIGHGVPGAMVSMLGNDLLNQAMNVGSCVHPGEFLTLLNQRVISNFKKDGKASVHNGMDIALCRFTPSGELEYAGAKNSLLILRAGELLEYKANRVSVGGITPEDYQFDTQEIKLIEGDTIYLFSDGFSDQFGGPKGKKFNIKKFKQLLIDHRDKTMEEQKQILEESLESWKGDIEQIDDICVIGIRV